MGWLLNSLIGIGAVGGGLFLLVRAMDPGPMDRPVSDHFDGQRFSLPAPRAPTMA